MSRVRWLPIVSAVLTLIMVVAVSFKLSSLDWHEVAALLPSSAAFWVLFVAAYVTTPAAEWLIFHRLWGMGIEGFPALLRKQIYNEIVLGYLGDTYFFAWAREHEKVTDAPFAAIKDSAILSALAGNLFTFLLVGALWPQLGHVLLDVASKEIYLSLLVVMLIPVVLVLARRRVLSLPRRQLVFVFLVHLARTVARPLLQALFWHLLLPQVSWLWWLSLSALRQLVSRLPLVSNKDLLFAGLTVVLLGSHVPIASAMALSAALLLAAHLGLAAVLVAAEVAGHLRARSTRRRAFAAPPES